MDPFETIEGTGFAKGFQRPFIHRPQIYPFSKIEDTAEGAFAVTLIDYGVDCRLTDPFNCCHPEADAPFFIHHEMKVAFIDIRAQDRNIEVFTLINKECDLLDLGEMAA